jgi:hypothetical protein
MGAELTAGRPLILENVPDDVMKGAERQVERHAVDEADRARLLAMLGLTVPTTTGGESE